MTSQEPRPYVIISGAKKGNVMPRPLPCSQFDPVLESNGLTGECQTLMQLSWAWVKAGLWLHSS